MLWPITPQPTPVIRNSSNAQLIEKQRLTPFRTVGVLGASDREHGVHDDNPKDGELAAQGKREGAVKNARLSFRPAARSPWKRPMAPLIMEAMVFHGVVTLAEPASLFDPEDTDAKERAIAAAEASPEADDVSLADVKRWLQSWGKADEVPPPPWP